MDLTFAIVLVILIVVFVIVAFKWKKKENSGEEVLLGGKSLSGRGMYQDTGSKIISMAKVFAILTMIVSIILGVLVILALNNEIGIIAGIAVAAVGCLLAWVENLLLAGFGELILNSNKILVALKGHAEASAKSNRDDNQ